VTEPTQGDTEGTFAYLSAPAFDNALRDLFVAAASTGTYGVNELRRQFAYDRFLTRVFSDNTDRWILKGGGGLLARMPGQARHSMDLDLFYQGQLDLAISTLQTVAAVDFGDFFSFDVEPGPAKDNGRARQLAIKAFLGNKEFQRFKIDLVVSSNMTQRPDTVAPLTPVNIPGLQLIRTGSTPSLTTLPTNSLRWSNNTTASQVAATATSSTSSWLQIHTGLLPQTWGER
jgi:hypothetical protein